MAAPTPKRRWFQYSLRTLLVFVTLCAFACSWLAVKLQQARRQWEAVDAIQRLGGGVLYDWQVDANLNVLPNPQPPGPKWLRSLSGYDFFQSVSSVFLPGGVTDKELQHVKGFNGLQQLWLFGARITDAGVEQLKDFNRLRELNVAGTPITDAGLQHLAGLNRLQRLSLDHSQITDAGMQYLTGLSQLTLLNLDSTDVRDAGLEHLMSLSQLRDLCLSSTSVTDAGVKRLQQALPNCKIQH
jgi:hypothetical protein